MHFISQHLDAIITAFAFLIAFAGNQIGKATAKARYAKEIENAFHEIETLREVIYQKSLSEKRFSSSHPAGTALRLVSERPSL